MKREITRTRKGTGAAGDPENVVSYCTVKIELTDGRLSISGESGIVMSRRDAKREARLYWETFFEDSPGALADMNARCGTSFRSPARAAKYVTDTDGEFHGIDAREVRNKIYVGHSWGQITDEIRSYFPEVEPLLPWHLNDMRCGAPDQEEAVKANKAAIEATPGNDWYTKVCAFLESKGLLYSKFNGEIEVHGRGRIKANDCDGGTSNAWGATTEERHGYKYGSGWVVYPLPPEIVKLAETVCSEG